MRISDWSSDVCSSDLAAMNDLLRPSLYDAWHDIRAIKPKGKRAEATVVGPVCEIGDTFARNRDMDMVQAGDLIAFKTAGAYGATMARPNNRRALTHDTRTSGDKCAVVRERPPINTLIEGDIIPESAR